MGFLGDWFGFRTAANTKAIRRSSAATARTAKKQLKEAQTHTTLLGQQIEQQNAMQRTAEEQERAQHSFRYSTDPQYRAWYDQRAAEQAEQRRAAEANAAQYYAAQATAQQVQRQNRVKIWKWVGWVFVPYIMIFFPPHFLPFTGSSWAAMPRERRILISAAWAVLVLVVAIVANLTGSST